MSESKPTVSPEVLELLREYARLNHAMMTGIGYDLEYNPQQAEDKHVRSGINSALVSHSALAKLLMAKGLITELEYWQAVIKELRNEVKSYEDKLESILEKRTGNRTKITLV